MSQHQKVHDFLKQHPMGILSTVSETGHPWGSAIYFVADEQFNFYFVTRAETFKYKNIQHKAVAALTIADASSQTTVQVAGEISTVPSDQIIDIAFNKLEKIKPKDDQNWIPPIYKVHKGDYMVLKLAPTKLQYANYKPFKSDIHEDYIENIIS